MDRMRTVNCRFTCISYIIYKRVEIYDLQVWSMVFLSFRFPRNIQNYTMHVSCQVIYSTVKIILTCTSLPVQVLNIPPTFLTITLKILCNFQTLDPTRITRFSLNVNWSTSETINKTVESRLCSNETCTWPELKERQNEKRRWRCLFEQIVGREISRWHGTSTRMERVKKSRSGAQHGERIRSQRTRSTWLMHVHAYLHLSAAGVHRAQFLPSLLLLLLLLHDPQTTGIPCGARVSPFEKSAERARSCNAGSKYRYSLERLRNWLAESRVLYAGGIARIVRLHNLLSVSARHGHAARIARIFYTLEESRQLYTFIFFRILKRAVTRKNCISPRRKSMIVERWSVQISFAATLSSKGLSGF